MSRAVILLLGVNGKDAYVVKGWKGIKKQRNKERNKKAGALALQKWKTFPSFIFHDVFGSRC